jgi:hypothetical protein
MLSVLTWILIMGGISGGMGCCWYWFPRERNHDALFDFESDDSSVYERIPYNMEN